MTTHADLVMPKLGLTMTEGKVAQWALAPGVPFAAGDILVVIETDKIAFDVEAPSAGTIIETLVPEGETVAVGTPIAQWMPSDGASAATTAPAQSPAAPETQPESRPAPPEAAPPAVPTATLASGGRIVATPYARRLARDANLDLATVTPSNARRVRAADVEAALAQRGETARTPALTRTPQDQRSSAAAAFVFYGTEVCVDKLLRLMDEINDTMPDLRPALSHFAALAAARALAHNDSTIGLQHDGGARRPLTSDATRRLSVLVAADRAETTATHGPITLLVSDATGVTLVGGAPVGCDAALGIGTLTRVFRPDADDRPVLRAEIRLMLTVGDAEGPLDAPQLLAQIRTLLENPLVLLAS